ncbi:signal peptidase II [Helcococcus ovis]|uniref:Signal peptidase II n=1 Tax=Helcococcus ovis TaxID=72026 RepID=A0A4R9C2I9_9FIRM|nr:signal peptidase II [Helcococcus ovis]TFF63980.1 signal peptidase II [Helcococcus ovis]TFF65693.1 signal peptidase II [Helcococcus ovis]
MEKIKKSNLLVLMLVFIDQFSKIIVNTFLKNNSFRIFGGKIGFDLYLNKDYMSVFNHDLNLNLSMFTLIIINIFILVFLVTSYTYVLKNKGLNNLLRILLLISIAGAICSLIDKIFWGGSLDFIVFFGYIIDLKDIMLYIGLVLFYIIYLFKYEIKKIDLNEIQSLSIKGYFQYLRNIF